MLRLVKYLHKFYKVLISPLLGERCRFVPFCSDYAVEAIEKHGFLAGLALAIYRVCRCHPFCRGGEDPVPERLPEALPEKLAMLGKFIKVSKIERIVS